MSWAGYSFLEEKVSGQLWLLESSKRVTSRAKVLRLSSRINQIPWTSHFVVASQEQSACLATSFDDCLSPCENPRAECLLISPYFPSWLSSSMNSSSPPYLWSLLLSLPGDNTFLSPISTTPNSFVVFGTTQEPRDKATLSWTHNDNTHTSKRHHLSFTRPAGHPRTR